MIHTVRINILPLKDLLDPQGKAVTGSLHNLGLGNITDVRIGKHMTLQVEAASAAEAKQLAEDACRKLLANPVMESFEVTVSE
ncbi:MAG: phosphoribosylformylglycinamidine synthase subunit PurS [Sphingobacteriales bacterium]|nr:MAG: phosphoribosylformylglycinamidine synthase subunit PurS [Sphingobacteriales bacterium]